MAGQLAVMAVPPDGYYNSALGKTGPALKAALHDLIDDHMVIPYSSSSFDAHDALDILDEDPANPNNVILIYSRRSEPKSNWPAWNREHLWPNSLGINDDPPAYSDLHNLRACDANVNSSRGNEFYDWSDTNAPSYALPAHVEAPAASSDSDSWEPPDSVKGDIARAQLYMNTRYTGDVPGESALLLTDQTQDITSANNLMGRLTTLLHWHSIDPVDAAEDVRNDGVFAYQGNRNPFVDHPEWVEAVYVPRLRIQSIPGGVRLRWDADVAHMELEITDAWPPTWAPGVDASSQSGQDWVLNFSVDSQMRLFRLVLAD